MIFNLTQPVLDSAPKFTYTGTYEYIDDGSGNWRIKFLTSGVFTPLKNMAIDAFLVGAGAGGGAKPSAMTAASSGGGGGFTKTVKAVNLTKNTTYEITVGVGGAPGADGGSTSAFNETAIGGKKGSSITGDRRAVAGGAGGSGGGGASTSSSNNAGIGGSDGSDGVSVSTVGAGGTGQGTTTREFGEATGDLYSGGGGGTAYIMYTAKPAAGGDGGGAKGTESAADNTGGGGGGGDGYGGSGIVVIRKHKEAAA